MPGLARREPRGEAADVFSRFDRMFDEWARMMPFRPMMFPRWREAEELVRVEEFREDGTLVIRADLPGIDPDKDVELTISDEILHIEAERREEDKREEKGYVRRELRYGSLSRSLPIPESQPGQPLERETPHLRSGRLKSLSRTGSGGSTTLATDWTAGRARESVPGAACVVPPWAGGAGQRPGSPGGHGPRSRTGPIVSASAATSTGHPPPRPAHRQRTQRE
jgi:HSP20 family protein